MARASLNVIVPGQLYQRANFLSWPRWQKEKLLKEHNIRVVVNLWSKSDPEVSSDSEQVYVYLHYWISGAKIPPEQELRGLLDFLMNCSKMGWPILIHCEAGVNRSVFLATLLAMRIQDFPNNGVALMHIREKFGRVKLNPKFLAYLENLT